MYEIINVTAFYRFWTSQVLNVPKTTLVALAHLKAEFIRGRERGRGERGYYVSAATVREREGPILFISYKDFPSAMLFAFIVVSERVTSGCSRTSMVD